MTNEWPYQPTPAVADTIDRLLTIFPTLPDAAPDLARWGTGQAVRRRRALGLMCAFCLTLPASAAVVCEPSALNPVPRWLDVCDTHFADLADFGSSAALNRAGAEAYMLARWHSIQSQMDAERLDAMPDAPPGPGPDGPA